MRITYLLSIDEAKLNKCLTHYQTQQITALNRSAVGFTILKQVTGSPDLTGSSLIFFT